MSILNIKLTRCHIGPVACDGEISINGQYVCDTAEHSAYMIAPGTYRVDLRRLPQFEHRTLCFEGAYLAVGNGIYGNRDCRILVGKQLVPGCLIHSRQAFEMLYDRVRKALMRDVEVQVMVE